MSDFLQGKRVLISAGPMRTAMDPVRYLQNRSSGKFGLEIARAAEAKGATITVLLGPVETAIAESYGSYPVVRYTGPAEYSDGLDRLFPECDVFFSLAAVLDFELIPLKSKMDRDTIAKTPMLNIPMQPVPDFVARMASRRKPGQVVIAFAAESGTDEEIEKRAYAKMMKKGVDAIVANPVRSGLGPEAEENLLWILRPDRDPIHAGPATKRALATPLLTTLFS